MKRKTSIFLMTQHHKIVQHLQNKIAELEAEVKDLKEELLYCYKGDQ